MPDAFHSFHFIIHSFISFQHKRPLSFIFNVKTSSRQASESVFHDIISDQVRLNFGSPWTLILIIFLQEQMKIPAVEPFQYKRNDI